MTDPAPVSKAFHKPMSRAQIALGLGLLFAAPVALGVSSLPVLAACALSVAALGAGLTVTCNGMFREGLASTAGKLAFAFKRSTLMRKAGAATALTWTAIPVLTRLICG